MAETCIVCLGDLPGHDRHESTLLGKPLGTDGTLDANDGVEHGDDIQSLDADLAEADVEKVAHLLPCGHYLHDDCLKPWVERANSCPICRANFNRVELSFTLGGPIISSYAVEDKQQVADIDPSMVVDDDDFEASIESCMVCEEFGDEAVLLLCDGCNASCHTFCAGLDSVPSGDWFCHMCEQDARVLEQANRGSRSRQRTSATQRRVGARRTGPPSPWARVWQSVWDRLNFDLDFPFDDEGSTPPRTQTRRREVNEWQRRFHVAERQGAANRFGATASTLLENRTPRGRAQPPAPESQEELRAWNVFDKAKQLQENERPSSRRKRKSCTTSPSEPAAPPERKLKRPRTRRAQDLPESSADVQLESSSSRRPANITISGPVGAGSDSEGVAGGPSFLQSLLKEVETARKPASSTGRKVAKSGPAVDRSASPRLSSPGASPTASNHATPRAMTPPSRPLSPPPLTSTITPIFPAAPEFSPYSPADDKSEHHENGNPTLAFERSEPRQRKLVRHSPGQSPTRSKDSSPTRHSLSFSTKSEIQKMVSAALKPLYQKQELNKDEYTDINRDVSRLLYDRVKDAQALSDQRERKHWQQVAATEVQNAVRALRTDVVDAAAA